MNAIQLLHQLTESHRALLEEAKGLLEEVGGCDHGVNICSCELIRRVDAAQAIQVEADAYAYRLTRGQPAPASELPA